MQETPNPPPVLVASPTQSSATSSSSLKAPGTPATPCTPAITMKNADESGAASKTNLIQRILQISEHGEGNRNQTRNLDTKAYNEDAKPTRGHNRMGRGVGNLSWRSNPKFLDEFHNNQDRNLRGGRGARGKPRMRGRGNFSPFGHQQHHFNEVNKNEWPSVGSGVYGSKDMDAMRPRDFKDNSFGMQGLRQFPAESNRLAAPYNYQALAHTHRERPKDSVMPDNMIYERPENRINERHDGNSQRFDAIRLPSPNLNRFGKPGQEWQQNQNQPLPYNSYSGQVS